MISYNLMTLALATTCLGKPTAKYDATLASTLNTLAADPRMSPTVVCVPGQCLQGYSNVSIGAVLSAPGATTDIHLLPGQYAFDTNPQLLHDLLTSPSSALAPFPGFNSSKNLPLNLALQPGIAIYSDKFYAGQPAFSSLPTSPAINSSTPLPAKSLVLASNIWIAARTGIGNNNRVVLWDSVPDVSQLPFGNSSSLVLSDIQSFACSPPCSGSSVCSASGTCQCASGFTGSSCESCAAGFFGPQCKPCPAGCTSCDDGISGTGRCFKPTVSNAPSTCNCINGVCGSDGQCACNAGFVRADNGTACAKCAPGFFLTSTGDCKACQLGCTQCADGTGACIACKNGFSQDANDKTKCNPPQSVTSTGTVCPDGSFSSGNSCTPCSPSCSTCTGSTSNDCIICAQGRFLFNGSCVGTNSDGVCEGSNLIADNNKHVCDACDAKCTSCKIPNFNVASTINQAQCTGCVPGYVLSQGKCVESCPSGLFVSPQDNLTCIPCDSSCSTCAGSSAFCLSCPSNQLASDGKCVSSCPSNSFSSSGSCLPCHPDCASCSGGSFSQCTACPSDRPVLVNGRCLPTCSKSQYFDSTTSTCQSCDSSCSSCSGSGPNNCLACSSSNQVLRAGSCTTATCKQSTNVVPGLGVCLSELITVPEPSGTTTPSPLPSVSGLTTPTVVHTRTGLEWWQILLMALGCAFIFVAVLWCWRRRARKLRAKKTHLFALDPSFNRAPKTGWRWRLVRFGEKLFGHRKSRRVVVYPVDGEEVRMDKLRAAEEARHEADMIKLIGSYEHSNSPPPSRQPSVRDYQHHHGRHGSDDRRSLSSASQLSAPSMYSQITGMPRRTPEPKQPVKMKKDLTSRFSASTSSSSELLDRTGTNINRPGPSKNPFCP